MQKKLEMQKKEEKTTKKTKKRGPVFETEPPSLMSCQLARGCGTGVFEVLELAAAAAGREELLLIGRAELVEEEWPKFPGVQVSLFREQLIPGVQYDRVDRRPDRN